MAINQRNENGLFISAFKTQSGNVWRNAYTVSPDGEIVTATYVPAMQADKLVWRTLRSITNSVRVDVAGYTEANLDGVELTAEEYGYVNEQLNSRLASFVDGVMQGAM